MSLNQSNDARLMYTVQNYIPSKDTKTLENHGSWILKNSNIKFERSPRSDEKICIPEKNIYAVIRTVLFIRVFNTSPNESILDIINTGEVNYEPEISTIKTITPHETIEFLDDLFGSNFCFTISRDLNRWFYEYNTYWKYYPFVSEIKLPSAEDYIKLFEFANINKGKHTKVTQFLRSNIMDNNMPLQKTKNFLK